MKWLDWEDHQVRETYPDYAAMQIALPHRSLKVLRARVVSLGIQRRHTRWSPLVKRNLKRLSGKLSDQEVADFMGCSRQAAAHARRLSGVKYPIMPTRISPLGLDVKAECADRGVGYREICRSVNVPYQVFLPPIEYGPAVRVVSILGGELYAEWDNDD